jgi:eukaryotic-like serine/threonine-protein kinase
MFNADVKCDPIEALAVDFIERQRRGDFLSVPEYARQHPELADEIRELFPAMLALDALRPPNERFTMGS